MRGLFVFICSGVLLAAHGAQVEPAIRIRSLDSATPVLRAQRPAIIEAVIENAGPADVEFALELRLPAGVRAVCEPPAAMRLGAGDEATLAWTITADGSRQGELTLRVRTGTALAATRSLAVQILEPLAARALPYLPPPEPVKTPILIGAHHCPLWEADQPQMWANVRKHPERTPALGFYAQENPEVSDWETKWAVEHGIGFFIYCWYRSVQGEPVKMRFGTAIHDALLKSKFVDQMKFTIMWENQSRGQAGVADERDLLDHLLPFWIDNYFRHPSYLKVDGRPVLFIYRPEFLVQDLGDVEHVARALDRMRQACRAAGFAGLTILGEYRGLDPDQLRLMKQLGLDYTFAYCWHVPHNPTPQQAIEAQFQSIRKTQELGILPQVVTVSQGWSGWRDEGSIWKIPPQDYESLLQHAKDFVATLPPDQLGSRMLLLDNWNEWGEGHYIAPYREFGFGYLDAVRKIFSTSPAAHLDLLPEDIGRGPYDTAYRTWRHQAEDLRKLLRERRVKTGVPADGLIGWWAFDEPLDSPVASDSSGHRLGGRLRDTTRAAGIDGQACVCAGGCVVVENDRSLSPPEALSIACWVKTDVAGQNDKWFVNRIFGGGAATGYRLGLHAGKPCFAVPLTDWSHHLRASGDLPTGRWTHIAGTFDGRTMRIYVDGQEQGVLERPGPVRANDFHLCLGSYDVGHAAHFQGLLDEVTLYARALTAVEVRAQYQRFAPPAPTADAVPPSSGSAGK